MAHGGDATTRKTLLILGRAGNGKSSTANSILAGLNFPVYHSFTSNDLQCQAQENKSIRVVCAPDLYHRMFINRQSKKGAEVEVDEEKEVRSWIVDHCKGEPDAVILVIRCDQRFTREDSKAFKRLKENQYLEKGMKKLVIVFTAGDRLNGREMRQELESDDPYLVPVRDIWNDAQKRYVVFDNTAKGARNDIQVNALMDVVKRMATHPIAAPHPFPQHICRLLFVGPGVTLQTGRTKLGIKGQLGIFDLNGLQMEVTFLLIDESTPEALEKVKIAASPGPHAILVLSDGNAADEKLSSAAEKLIRTSFCPLAPATYVRKFIQVVDIKQLSNREALSALLHEDTFLARKNSGEFFYTAELGKNAEGVCEETMKVTETSGKSVESSYETYLSVKQGKIA